MTRTQVSHRRLAILTVIAASAADLAALENPVYERWSVQPATGDDNWQIMEVNGAPFQNSSNLSAHLNALSGSADYQPPPDNDLRRAVCEATEKPGPLVVKYNVNSGGEWSEQTVEVQWSAVA